MKDTQLVKIDLHRPEHLADEAWTAIELHRQRLETALRTSDRPWVIGSAKELVESVARAVVEAKGVVVGSNADFDSVVNQAHKVLERQAGPDISMSPDIRNIASSARKIVTGVRRIRNDVGTGHGRARLDPIDDEKASVVVDAAALWARWALRRLEHVLLREADRLIAKLRGPVTRASLSKHLEALVLPDQPPEMQRALGVAFAQRAASGTFVAREVGVDGPSSSEDLAAWPAEYRFGVVEGLGLTGTGFVRLAKAWVPTVVDVLSPIPPAQTKDFLHDLNAKVATSGLPPSKSIEELLDTAQAIRQNADRLPEQAQSEWSALAEQIDPTTDEDTSPDPGQNET